jgi:hypothetical protein
MEPIINTMAVWGSNAAVFLVTSGTAFVVFAVLWTAFGAGLIWSQGSVDAAWHWIRSLQLLAQLLVWFLFLPVVIGLWVWETTWPFIVRLVLVVGLAGWNLLMFVPRVLPAGR